MTRSPVRSIWTCGNTALALAIAVLCRSAPASAACPSQGCGSNTRELSGTWIEAVYFGKQPVSFDLGASSDPLHRVVRFVPHSLKGGRCDPGGFELRLDDGWLVGRTSSGKSCSEREVIGATFRIEVPVDQKPESSIWEIQVEDVRVISTWEVQRALRRSWPQYGFRIREVIAGVRPGRWEPLCPEKRTNMWAEQQDALTGHIDITREEKAGWIEASRRAFLIQGETYDTSGSVVPTRSGPSWFNVGCIGSAFSKMRLMGLDPMADTSPGQHAMERQTVLKMITARYRGDESFTSDGMPIVWSGPGRAVDYYLGMPTPHGPIEATWQPSGAACLSHQRIWRHPPNTPHSHPAAPTGPADPGPRSRGTSEADDRSMLVTALGAFNACGAAVSTVWMSYTVDHID